MHFIPAGSHWTAACFAQLPLPSSSKDSYILDNGSVFHGSAAACQNINAAYTVAVQLQLFLRLKRPRKQVLNWTKRQHNNRLKWIVKWQQTRFRSTIMMESVLDRLGEEVTGIVSPVSLCMALTVGLVRLLNPTGDAAGSSVYIASAYYKEQVRMYLGSAWPFVDRHSMLQTTVSQVLSQGDDSTSEKITGSIINAAIFVGVIALMTFLLVLLFKYGVSVLALSLSKHRWYQYRRRCTHVHA